MTAGEWAGLMFLAVAIVAGCILGALVIAVGLALGELLTQTLGSAL